MGLVAKRNIIPISSAHCFQGLFSTLLTTKCTINRKNMQGPGREGGEIKKNKRHTSAPSPPGKRPDTEPVK